MIHRIIGKYLRDSDAIRDAVAECNGTGFFFERAPQNTTGRHIIISEVTGSVFNALTNEIGTTASVVQVNAYGRTPAEARQLGQLCRNRLSGFAGNVDYLTDSGTEATAYISVTQQRKGIDITDPEDASDKWKYAHSADYLVFHPQTVPDHT